MHYVSWGKFKREKVQNDVRFSGNVRRTLLSSVLEFPAARSEHLSRERLAGVVTERPRRGVLFHASRPLHGKRGIEVSAAGCSGLG